MQQGNAQFPLLLEFFALLLVEEAFGHCGDVVFGQCVLVGDDDLAIHAERRWHAHDQMQVRGIKVVGRSQKAVEEGMTHVRKRLRHQPQKRAKPPTWASSRKARMTSG
jgi:hypothetical protein